MIPDRSRVIVEEHLRNFFAGHACQEKRWTTGPRFDEIPRLSVLEFSPGPKSNQWMYATLGGYELSDDPRLELILVAPEQNDRQVELLTMTAWYHSRHRLGNSHTIPIGEPWLPGSSLDHYLISTPYPFGPNLELCNLDNAHVHILWLLPITTQERDFKINAGMEALEQRFDDVGIEYWKPDRKSTVPY